MNRVTRGVLLLAGPEERLLVGTVEGKDDEVERMPPQQKLSGHAVADDLELVIGSPPAPARALDQPRGLRIVVQHQDRFTGSGRPPLDQAGQLQAARPWRRRRPGPSRPGERSPAARWVPSSIVWILMSGFVSPARSALPPRDGLASEGERPHSSRSSGGPTPAAALDHQGRHADLQRKRLEHRRQGSDRLEGELARFSGHCPVSEHGGLKPQDRPEPPRVGQTRAPAA